MNVYFYDGPLSEAPAVELVDKSRYIDAGDGPTANLSALAFLTTYAESNGSFEMNVLTNSILALDHEYAWDEIENHTAIYLYVRKLQKYIRIDRLTEKELREGHNIAKMYLAGAFDLTGELND